VLSSAQRLGLARGIFCLNRRFSPHSKWRTAFEDDEI